MFKSYFQQELSNLREIAEEFAKENPAIAPMLGEQSTDPDVERIIESVAFLTSGIKERIDDEFPEIVHDFLRQVWPHYLRPVPSSTIISFNPEADTGEIEKEIYIDSVPVHGTKCQFKTCSKVILYPIDILNIKYIEGMGKNPFIRIELNADKQTFDFSKINKLRFFLGGNYKNASDLYYILMTKLNKIIFQCGESRIKLDKKHLKGGGFSTDEALIPYPSNSFSGYRYIQEYFHMPEKFLFIDVKGFEKLNLKEQSQQLYIDFELKDDIQIHLNPKRENFVLFATPAVNIFPYPAIPVITDHKKNDYPVFTDTDKPENFHIYNIDKVTGFIRGVGKEIDFESFHSFKNLKEKYIYKEKLNKSKIYEKIDHKVSISYPAGFNSHDLKTLSFEILCTNGNLPLKIPPGGICEATWSSPAFAAFKNITSPTAASLPQIGSESLWNLISLLTLNPLSLSEPENLKTILKIYLPKDGNINRKKTIANEKRIEGIKSIETKQIDRLVKGFIMRGLDIKIQISLSNFAGIGDLYLFGVILDNFFGLFVSMNTFTRLVILETDTGEILTWPERIGNRQLI